jgi:chromosome segregation ATPase
MEEEIQGLSERIERLLATVRRLGDENIALRRELAESRSLQSAMQQRIHEARTRVEAALSRLPLLVNEED